MRIINFGIRIPQNKDGGVVWAKALEHNWENVYVTHNHNGVNSEKLSIDSLDRKSTLIRPVDWTNHSNGSGYIQNVSLPSGLSLDKVEPIFYINSGPERFKRVHPQVNPLSLTTYELIINDSSLELVALYI